MARLWTSGSELNDLTAEGLTIGAGAVTSDTGVVRSGTISYKADSGAGNAVQHLYRTFGGAVGKTYYARAFVRAEDLPTTNASIIEFQTSAGVYLARVRLNTSGVFILLDGTGTNLGSGPTAVADTWYRVELKLNIGVGATDNIELLVNGTSYVAATGLTISESAPDRLAFGWITAPGASRVLNLDDLALNDDTGSDQQSFPGDGHVVALKPTADSAVGSGWTVGDGTNPVSTNLFGGVDNTPPVGVADVASTPNQIRNATADNATNYDATMQTYTAAGVPSGASIAVARLIAVTGCSSTTNTNAALAGVSNPNFGNTTIAFQGAAIAGAHPTGWIRRESAPVYDPVVTLGDAPVMRIGKRSAVTRVGLCSLLVLQVEYRVLHPLSVTGNIVMTGTATVARLRTTHPLVTSVSLTATATATKLRIAHALTASFALTAVAAVDRLRLGHPLVVGASLSGTAAVDRLRTTHPLAATVSLTGIATADLATPTGLRATVALSATASVLRLAMIHELASSVALTATATAVRLRTTHPLATTVAIDGIVAVERLRTTHALVAATALTAVAVVDLVRTVHALSAVVSLVGTASAEASGPGIPDSSSVLGGSILGIWVFGGGEPLITVTAPVIRVTSRLRTTNGILTTIAPRSLLTSTLRVPTTVLGGTAPRLMVASLLRVANGQIPAMGARGLVTTRLRSPSVVEMAQAPVLVVQTILRVVAAGETILAPTIRGDLVFRVANSKGIALAPPLFVATMLRPATPIETSLSSVLRTTMRLRVATSQQIGLGARGVLIAILRPPTVGTPVGPGTGILLATELADWVLHADADDDWVLESSATTDYVLLATMEITVDIGRDRDSKTYRPGDSVEFALLDMRRKSGGTIADITSIGAGESIVFSVLDEDDVSRANGVMSNNGNDFYGIFSAPTPDGKSEDYEIEAVANLQSRTRTFEYTIHVEKTR